MGAPASFNNLRLTGESDRSFEADRSDEGDRLSRAADFPSWTGPRLTIMASPSDEESSDLSASFFFFFSFFCFFFFLWENQLFVIIKSVPTIQHETILVQTLSSATTLVCGNLHFTIRKRWFVLGFITIHQDLLFRPQIFK